VHSWRCCISLRSRRCSRILCCSRSWSTSCCRPPRSLRVVLLRRCVKCVGVWVLVCMGVCVCVCVCVCAKCPCIVVCVVGDECALLCVLLFIYVFSRYGGVWCVCGAYIPVIVFLIAMHSSVHSRRAHSKPQRGVWCTRSRTLRSVHFGSITCMSCELSSLSVELSFYILSLSLFLELSQVHRSFAWIHTTVHLACVFHAVVAPVGSQLHTRVRSTACTLSEYGLAGR
jgi:hypothetical protein